MNHYPPNRMINVLNCLLFPSYTFFPRNHVCRKKQKNNNSTLFRFIMAKSSSISMRFDEFKLLTRKSCFCLACNKKFFRLFAPFTGKGRKKKVFLFNLTDEFCLFAFLARLLS